MSNLCVLSEDFRSSPFCIHAVSPAHIKQGPALQTESVRLILSCSLVWVPSGAAHMWYLLSSLGFQDTLEFWLPFTPSTVSQPRVCKAEEDSKNPTS